MLPLLDKKHALSVIIGKRAKEALEHVRAEHLPDHDHANDPAMDAAAEDVLRAIDQRDVKKLSLALRNAFQIADSNPHEEGPHIEHEDRGEL